MLLNVHSNYSLRYGTIPVSELVDLLIAEGHHTAVLTDINNSTGVLEFIKACRERLFNGLAGMEFRDGDRLLYFGIARNNKGFQHMPYRNVDHPFIQDYYQGITKAEAERRIKAMMS